MINPVPSKTFRGSVEEVFSHRDEIPAGAVLELKIYEPLQENADDLNAYGGKTAAEVLLEIGLVNEGPPDLARNPRYMEGFGETRNRRSLEP